MKSYRMASWWLRPWHLPFNKKVRDDFRRRASDFAQAGADSAIIFGAHFRWDFEHEMDQIHELIAFAAEELAQYKIVLFDHHSTVLTCSCRREISSDRSANFSNHRQVLLSRPAGSRTTDFHDDWKMLNIDDGKPVFLPQYSAEEFCFSNPDFVAAYLNYVRRLLRETGIGGLMMMMRFITRIVLAGVHTAVSYSVRNWACLFPHPTIFRSGAITKTRNTGVIWICGDIRSPNSLPKSSPCFRQTFR